MPVVYLLHSLIYGKDAPANPWLLPGLEWRTASPPPTENFERTPIVTWEAYDFSEDNGLDVEAARREHTVSTV
jgi:cytochrome c oxidase subunit 1